MRLVALAALLLAASPSGQAQMISCWGGPRPAPDLVVRGTVVGEQVRRVVARGVAFHVVRSTLEVEELLWGDADRPTPRQVDLHGSRRVDEGPAPTWRGRQAVWSLWRTELPNVFSVSDAGGACSPPGDAPRGRVRGGRLTGEELSIELRLENPSSAPVSFPLREECFVLHLDLFASERYGATWSHLPGAPIVVPPGRYRTRILQQRDARHLGQRDVGARLIFSLGLGIVAKETWRERVQLRDSAPPELEQAELVGGWLSGLRWVGGPSRLDPDDPALRPQPTRPLRPRDGLAPAIAAFAALLVTVRRRKSLPGEEGGR